jgi:hypothetical protein
MDYAARRRVTEALRARAGCSLGRLGGAYSADLKSIPESSLG